MSDTPSLPQKPPFNETELYRNARAEYIQKVRASAEYNSIRLDMADEDIVDCVRRFTSDVSDASHAWSDVYFAYMRGKL